MVGRCWRATGNTWRHCFWSCTLCLVTVVLLMNASVWLLESISANGCAKGQQSCHYPIRNIRSHDPARIHDADFGQTPPASVNDYEVIVSPRRMGTSQNDKMVPSETQSQHDMRMRSDMERTRHLWPWGKLRGCNNLSYKTTSLANTSVIITFHDNEILSDILHTVRSVLLRTPPRLLTEVILVDDGCEKAELREELVRQLAAEFPTKVRLLRSVAHLGLIRARLLGMRAARGHVIVCMDSHMEVQERWLMPLLDTIRQNRRTLAASYLDWMREKDGVWEFTHGASSWKTYFDWSFAIGFQDIPEREKQNRNDTQPVRTPITIGGIFAIEKQFFRDIGEFDDGMKFWGGENIDLALRVWLFGGRVVNVPCSHVAHLERLGHRNYRVGRLHDMWTNHKRVTEVWLGEYAKYLYYYNPHAKDIEVGDLSRRIALKQSAVHDFSWFVKNVFPELGIPDVDTFAWGGVRNKELNRCFNGNPPSQPTFRTCTSSGFSQGIFWSNTGELRMPAFTINVQSGTAKLEWKAYIPLYRTDSITKWIHWKGGPLRIFKTNQCLHGSRDFAVSLAPCNDSDPLQQWTFQNYTKEWANISHDRYMIDKSSYRETILKAIREHSQDRM